MWLYAPYIRPRLKPKRRIPQSRNGAMQIAVNYRTPQAFSTRLILTPKLRHIGGPLSTSINQG